MYVWHCFSNNNNNIMLNEPIVFTGQFNLWELVKLVCRFWMPVWRATETCWIFIVATGWEDRKLPEVSDCCYSEHCGHNVSAHTGVLGMYLEDDYVTVFSISPCKIGHCKIELFWDFASYFTGCSRSVWLLPTYCF